MMEDMVHFICIKINNCYFLNCCFYNSIHSYFVIFYPEKNNNKLDEDRDDFLSYSSPRGSTEGPVDFKKNNINRSIGDQTIAQDVPVELEENIQIGKIRGKVKNIINNFNEDLSRSQSDKPKYIRKVKVKEDVKTQKTKEYPENIYNSDVESAAHIDVSCYLLSSGSF